MSTAPSRARQQRFAPPSRQPGHISRPRVVAAIEQRLQNENAVLVIAPSGYGKTSAVAEWAAGHSGRVAWVTLAAFDTDAARIGQRVLQALQEVARGAGGEDLVMLLDADPDLEPAVAFDVISEALRSVDSPVYLVVDDSQRAREQLSEGLLGALIELHGQPLGLVIAGTSFVEAALARRILSHPEQVIRAEELAFDLAELESVQAGLPESASKLLVETKGWPIAIRAVQFARAQPREHESGEALLHAYFRDSVLASLPPEIAEFALITSVSGENGMSVEMATAVSGRGDSAALLERCVGLGLFIDRYGTAGSFVYRWHSVFARRCQVILEERDPEVRTRALAVAGEFAAAQGAPLVAADYWLKTGDIEAAITVMLAHWVSLLVGQGSDALDRWCTALPAPHDEDPRVLLMRACAQDLAGARDVAQILLGRAEARAAELPPAVGYDLLRSQALLQLADDRGELMRAAEHLRALLAAPDALSPRARAGTLHLLGFAEIRLRYSHELTVQFLSAAVLEAEALGDIELARRAHAHLTWSLAWAGEFEQCRAMLDRHPEQPDDDSWAGYGGGGAAMAAGYMAYWADDFGTALAELTRAINSASSPSIFSAGARAMVAISAAASRDAATCRWAARGVQDIPNTDRQGIVWSILRESAIAALHEAAGHRDSAMKIVARHQDVGDEPFVTVILAGIAVRAGHVQLAASMLRRVSHYRGISYVRVMALATESMLHRQLGRPTHAHEVLEQALDTAAVQDVRRPFSGGGLEMRKLLTAHLAWGTRHEEFMATCLAPRSAAGPLSRLSERESAVFAHLRTTKTMQEIADTLSVSINTVKTHQRAIYRKLGVATRRDAVRMFL